MIVPPGADTSTQAPQGLPKIALATGDLTTASREAPTRVPAGL